MPLTVNRRTLAALGLGWAVAARTGAAPALPTELRFAYMDKTPAVTEKAIAVLTSAYARLGIAVTFVPLPFARSLMEANAGIYDGEAARVAVVAEQAPALRRVDVAVSYVEYVALTRRQDHLTLADWAAVIASGKRLGGRNGALYLSRAVGDNLAVKASSYESLVKMLLRGRLDVALLPRNEVAATVRAIEPEFPTVAQDLTEGPPLSRELLHHFLHERHSALVPEIERVLRGMEQQGKIASIWQAH